MEEVNVKMRQRILWLHYSARKKYGICGKGVFDERWRRKEEAAIKTTMEDGKEYSASRQDILEKLKRKFGLSETDAHKMLELYWKKSLVKKGGSVMLEMIRGTEVVSAKAVRKKYPNCHYILTDVNDDLCDLKGKLYCVSYSHDSYKELCAIEDSLEAEGIKCAELGIYDDGHAIGLQHEIV